jgi:hypothetical protein
LFFWARAAREPALAGALGRDWCEAPVGAGIVPAGYGRSRPACRPALGQFGGLRSMICSPESTPPP